VTEVVQQNSYDPLRRRYKQLTRTSRRKIETFGMGAKKILWGGPFGCRSTIFVRKLRPRYKTTESRFRQV